MLEPHERKEYVSLILFPSVSGHKINIPSPSTCHPPDATGCYHITTRWATLQGSRYQGRQRREMELTVYKHSNDHWFCHFFWWVLFFFIFFFNISEFCFIKKGKWWEWYRMADKKGNLIYLFPSYSTQKAMNIMYEQGW